MTRFGKAKIWPSALLPSLLPPSLFWITSTGRLNSHGKTKFFVYNEKETAYNFIGDFDLFDSNWI